MKMVYLKTLPLQTYLENYLSVYRDLKLFVKIMKYFALFLFLLTLSYTLTN